MDLFMNNIATSCDRNGADDKVLIPSLWSEKYLCA
jgi:hypothetical protein